MTDGNDRPTYGGVTIYRDFDNPDENFDEYLDLPPYHAHPELEEDEEESPDETSRAEHWDMVAQAIIREQGLIPAVADDESEDESQPPDVPKVKRIPAAKYVSKVKFYNEGIHHVKKTVTRTNFDKIGNVATLLGHHESIIRMVHPEHGDHFGTSQAYRMEMRIELPEVDVENPSVAWFDYIFPVAQLLKNQAKLLHLSNKDLSDDFQTLNHWFATKPEDSEIPPFFPECLIHHNPFFGWGHNKNKSDQSSNEITSIGRTLAGCYYNQMGITSEKFYRAYAKQFIGKVSGLSTILVGSSGDVIGTYSSVS